MSRTGGSDRAGDVTPNSASVRLRVLWVTSTLLPAAEARLGYPARAGGGWLGATLDALRAARPDLDVTCAAWAWPSVEPFELAGVRYVTLPRRRPRSGVAGVARAWMSDLREDVPVETMRDLLESTRPDIVHVHGTETANTLAVLRAAEGLPVLVSLQGLVTEVAPVFLSGLGFTDRLADIASMEFAKGRGLTHASLRMRRAARTERRILALTTDVSGRTDFDRLAALRANPQVSYRHVDEALRRPFYTTEWRGLQVGSRTILAVASDAPFKGVDVLLRAYALVRQRCDCRLIVVGQFEGTHLWRSLESIQSRLGISGCVEWAGAQPAESVAGLMAECGVFVNASRMENSSNGVCEAMLVGAPVIASRVGGTPSLIDDGDTGVLVDPEDFERLAVTIEEVLGDPALAGRLGSRARAVALARHDPASVANSLLGAYIDIAGRRHT